MGLRATREDAMWEALKALIVEAMQYKACAAWGACLRSTSPAGSPQLQANALHDV